MCLSANRTYNIGTYAYFIYNVSYICIQHRSLFFHSSVFLWELQSVYVLSSMRARTSTRHYVQTHNRLVCESTRSLCITLHCSISKVLFSLNSMSLTLASINSHILCKWALLLLTMCGVL